MSTGIIAAGCTFPSGPSLVLADIAIRTQLALIRNHPLYMDRYGMPVKASYFTQPELSFGINRWQVMADQALQNALSHTSAYNGSPIRLWLVIPSMEKPGIPQTLEESLKISLLVHLPDCTEIKVLRGSHAEAGNALSQICEKQQSDSVTTLDIVVAVDSWLPQESMAWLEGQQLLHGSHIAYNGTARRNPYGRIPGEGAAVIILAPENKMAAWSSLQGLATGQEAVLRNDDNPCIGSGLTQAAQQAINAAGNPVISHVVTDFNGEPYRADEYGFTLSRLQGSVRDDVIRVAPVIASGDIGCASLVMHLAQTAWRQKQPLQTEENTTVLVLASSDDSQRCAVLLRPANQGRNIA